MSSLKINLFEEGSIGRFYQLVALSIAHHTLWHSAGGVELARKIETGLTTDQINLTQSEAEELFNTLIDYLNSRVCGAKTNFYPSLYTAGRGDKRILNSMGIPVNRVFSCDQLVQFYKQGSLMRRFNDEIDIPMCLRTYVFSHYRGGGAVEETTVSSLYLALIGLFIAAVGRVVKGNEKFELYVNPDGSLTTLREGYVMYSLINEPNSKVKTQDVLNTLLQLSGVSLELSSILALTLYVYHVSRYVLKLSSLSNYYNVFERFRLVCINPKDRPLVLWERPLTLTHLIQRLDQLNILDLLEHMDESIRYAVKLGNKVDRLKDYPDAIATCINDIYGFLETNVLDTILHCIGSLSRVRDSLDEACRDRVRDACNASRAANTLIQRISRLV